MFDNNMKSNYKVTKTPKRVRIQKTPVTKYVLGYTCPTCHVEFQGLSGVGPETTRFRCRCGQELIVESEE